MSGEIVTSTGSLGADFSRSFGRGYFTAEEKISSLKDFSDLFWPFVKESVDRGNRRYVFRARVNAGTAIEILDKSGTTPEDFEVSIPLREVYPTDDFLIMLGGNIHRSEVPEWPEVYSYWSRRNGCQKRILDRISCVRDQGFSLTDSPSNLDITDLARIWAPFGWTENGVKATLQEGFWDKQNRWFSGIRETQSNRLVSACMGERLDFAGIKLVEGTEYGTLAQYQGRGLCTAAVINLHCQILNSTYLQDGQLPLIASEFNMTSRSDVIGRHTGMTIPMVEEMPYLEAVPRQVLRRNVAVFDNGSPNDIHPNELAPEQENFKASYGTEYRFWRNFILGILPRISVERLYPSSDIYRVLDLNRR